MKKGLLINDNMQMELQDLKGNTLRSIIHFGAYESSREKLFKGKKSIEIDINDFDYLAETYCSPYSK